LTEPVLIPVKGGWAARADGWAVYAPTKEEALRKFEEAKRRHQEIEARPLFCERLKELEPEQD
jgi:hypothetical protein